MATANGNRTEDTPDAIEHATPDVDLAEAQLALGRPEFAEAEPAASTPADEGSEDDERDPADPEDEEPLDAEPAGDGGGGGYDEDEDDLGPEDSGSGRGGRGASTAVAARRENPGLRIVHFLQGSWRELQRVQWPDRRQVMQATGVVIGFVIVAGAFLGVADVVAQKIVKLILP
ncbi:MAG TPA: preprotein translocase subunit SecE [Solirubrobacteraceae bacterium]